VSSRARTLTLVFCLAAAPGLIHGQAFRWLDRLFGGGTIGADTYKASIQKLNGYPQYRFREAYRTEKTWAFYSDANRTQCWLKLYDSDGLADLITQEIADHHEPIFRYGNWIGYCQAGDTEALAKKVRYILIGAGEWKE
jgi:hypothetical protein